MAACVECGKAVPRGTGSCPRCGTPVERAERRPAARPGTAATPEPAAKQAVQPVVKAVAQPVTPTVKGGTAAVTPTPKPAAAAPPARAAAAPPARAAKPGRKTAAARTPAARAETSAASAAERYEAAGPEVPAATAAERYAAAAPELPAAPAAAPAPSVAPERAGDPYAAAYADVDAVLQPGPSATAHTDVPAAPRRRTGRRRPWAGGDVIGEADERDPDDPVVHAEEQPDGPLPPALEERFDPEVPEPRGWALPLRVLRGDWLTSLATAVPAFVTTFVVAVVATGSLLVATKPRGDDLLVGNTSAGRFLDYVCAAVGLVFGGRVTVAQDAGDEYEYAYAVRFVPLTVTAVALFALWWFARRAHQRNVAPDRLADAVRTAAVYAAGVAVVTAFARWSVVDPFDAEEEDFFGASDVATEYSMSPWPPAFWAFCAAFAVVYLATGRLVATGGWATWVLAARGALVGLGVGCATCLLLLLVLGYTYSDKVGAESSDVTNALPLGLAYGLGFAAAAFGFVSGGRVVLPTGERARWDLLSPWLSNAYLLLLVIPAISVVVAALYVTRRRGVPPAEAVRACARMGFPAMALWFLVALVGSPSVAQTSSFGPAGDLSAGPVLWGALVVGLWFGAGGWLAGWLLARRSPRLSDELADDDDLDDYEPYVEDERRPVRLTTP